jgi:hypothetical protein
MDDALFMGLRHFSTDFNIYFAISDYENGTASTMEARAETIPFPWKAAWLDCAQSYKVVDYTIKYDACIVGQAHIQNQQKFLELQHLMKPNVPIAWVYCLDDGGPQMEPIIPYTHVFVNNCMADFNNGSFLPLACPYYIFRERITTEPEYAVNCQLGYTWPSRAVTTQAVMQSVTNLGLLDKSSILLYRGEELLLGNSLKTPLCDYPSLLMNTKIIVSDRGTGHDAYRFWEALATGNFVLCSPRNLFVANHMPIPDNVIFWNNEKELQVLIKCLMDVPMDKLMEIRDKSRRCIEKYHLPHRRVEKILQAIF